MKKLDYNVDPATAQNQIAVMAEAKYQQGVIAQEAIRYREALSHYERSAQLSPDTAIYWSAAG